jgi:hypothetical protein
LSLRILPAGHGISVAKCVGVILRAYPDATWQVVDEAATDWVKSGGFLRRRGCQPYAQS